VKHIISIVITCSCLVNVTVTAQQYRLFYKLSNGQSVQYQATSTLWQRIAVPDNDVVTEVVTTLPVTISAIESVLQQTTLALQWGNAGVTITTGPTNSPSAHTDSTVTVPTSAISERWVLLPTGTVISKTVVADSQALSLSEMISSTKISDYLFTPFPPHELRIGEMWSVPMADTTTSENGKNNVVSAGTIRYTLDGITDTLGTRCWKISFGPSTISQNGTLQGQAMALNVRGSGSIAGWSLHDIRTGMPVHTVATITSTIYISGDTDKAAAIPEIPALSKLTIVINKRSGGH